MQKILILGASILQVPAIKKAKEMGLYVVCVDMNPNAIGFKYCDKYEVVSTTDDFGVLRVANQYNVDGIITLASDRPIKTVAYVAEKLGLPALNLEAARNSTDKFLMREMLKKHNVPIPNYFSICSYSEMLTRIGDILGKIIVKPRDNSGSRGVSIIDSDNPETIKKAYDYAMENSYNKEIIIEEYMEGNEISVECIIYHNKVTICAITDKVTTGIPYFVEMGHSEPSLLSKEIINEVNVIVNKTIEVLGINNSSAHIEIMITPNGPKIVEVGARLGGDNITTHLVPLSTGIDMVKAIIDLSLGNEPNLDVLYSKGSAIRYFDFKPGVIKKINIDYDSIKKIGFIELVNFKNDGEVIDEIINSSKRMGYVICQANTNVEAIRKCENIIKGIDVIYE